ncbi:MAG: YajQ family cyclic di-GMP-binding protein [Elusimicrobia bacterium]|nr:YajQ family cyclic di-GMP-binding protein [Elusimicrobiota bacterium]
MASDYSFDVVSKVEHTLVEEAVSNATKEIVNRYDFKGSNSTIEFNRKEETLMLVSSDEYKVKALYDVLQTKLSKRGLPLKNFEPGKIEHALGGQAKQSVKIQQGIPQEKGKMIGKFLKDRKIKANSSIQGDSLRISSKSKDVLQDVMALLKEEDFGIALQFDNYR